MKTRPLVILFACLAFSLSLWAGAPTVSDPPVDDPVNKLAGKSGKIELSAGLAMLDLKNGYTYLDPDQTKYLLEEVWQNPDGSGFLGAVLPPGFGDGLGEGAWAALISYEDSGHVKDDDAASLNYDDLLKELRDSAAEGNKERKKQGYEEVEIVGWATSPHYDATAKTLYWARELEFGGAENHTLNYEIRVLGRTGVLSMNLVAGLGDLAAVEKATPVLLGQVAFQAGQLYADYQEGTDHLAEFGVAGLILGGIALKAGFLKILLGILAASWKFILIGVAGVGGFLLKKFAGRTAKTTFTPMPLEPSTESANPELPETSTPQSNEPDAGAGEPPADAANNQAPKD